MKKEVAIRVSGVTKSYKSHNKKIINALDGISIDIYEGEVLGILGPNGAGKTTFLNVLSTLLMPDSGHVEIYGIKLIPKNYTCLKRYINLSSGHPNFPWSLTVEENLKFYGMLYGLYGSQLKQRIKELLDMFGIEKNAKQRFDELSSGSKQKLSLAKALLNEPRIIFLDEPTIGLDPDIALKTREIIHNVFSKTKSTVLFTSHNMQEVDSLCSRVAFIKQGRLLKLSTPDELKKDIGKKSLEEVFIDLAHSDIKGGGVPSGGGEGILVNIEDNCMIHCAPRGLLKRFSAWFKKCLAFTYRNSIFAKRNFFAFAELVFWPVVGLISIGLLGGFLQLEERALGFVLTGAITSGILQVVQLDVAYSLLYEVWSKSVKHTFLTPIGTTENLFGSWVIGIVRGSIIFVILGVSAFLFFGFRMPPVGMMLVFLTGIFFSALILGLLVSFLILSFGQKAEITAWMFAYLFMIICGIYYPIDTLPVFFQKVSEFIPITYFLEYLRQGFGFEPLLKHGLIKGFGLIFVYLFIGVKFMNYALRRARIKGVIVRLSE